MGETILTTNNSNTPTPTKMTRNLAADAPPPPQGPLRCPRCDSSNTKFCYYNNYSLAQPRHFCKSCKRYWTRGGTLRNVPVGGGCRKNKRSKKPPNSAVQKISDRPLSLPNFLSNNPLNNLLFSSSCSNSSFSTTPNTTDNTDMNLAFSTLPLSTTPTNANTNNSVFLGPLGFNQSSQLLVQQGDPHQLSPVLPQTGVVDEYSIFGNSFLSSFKLPFDGNGGSLVGVLNKEMKVEGDSKIEWQIPCENSSIDAINCTAVVATNPSYMYW